MNFFHASGAALVAIAAAAPAHAQSVTVYGRLNLTVESQKTTGDRITVLQNNSSRWGLKGSEDLGGGLKAGFQLESGFAADTGRANDPFWGRQSELNLSGDFGTVRLGTFFSEAYYATADYISNHNHDTGTSSDALYAYIGRNQNKVAYRLPTLMQGLSVEVATSLKEAGSTNTYDGAVNYVSGPWQLGLGYEKAGAAEQATARVMFVGSGYGIGAYYQRDKNAWSTAGSRNNLRASGYVNVGSGEVHVNLGTAGKVGGASNSDAKQFTLGYNHNLSKRTKLYAFYTRLDDSAAKVYGGDFSSFAGGIRHNF
jgi:predicted porin